MDLARNLGFTTVAEGVESEAILKRLNGFGCDVVQGYFISQPLPANQLVEWFSESPYSL